MNQGKLRSRASHFEFKSGRRSWGRHLFGGAPILLGFVGLVWQDFDNIWQPVPDGTPGRTALAILTSLIMLGAGTGLQRRQWVRGAAFVLAVPYLAFALLWSRRIIGFPTIVATWGGTAEQVALVCACVALAAERMDHAGGSRATGITIQIFGTCAIAFGANHFSNLAQTGSMVPTWVPGTGIFWAAFTGAAMVVAGLAILFGRQAHNAARGLTLMFLVFQFAIWAPRIVSAQPDHIAWAGNAMNLALVSAAWVIADVLEKRREDRAMFRLATDMVSDQTPRPS